MFQVQHITFVLVATGLSCWSWDIGKCAVAAACLPITQKNWFKPVTTSLLNKPVALIDYMMTYAK